MDEERWFQDQRVLEGAHIHIVMTINSSMVKNCATRVTLYGRSHSGRVLTAQLPIKMDSRDLPEIELATCKFSLSGES